MNEKLKTQTQDVVKKLNSIKIECQDLMEDINENIEDDEVNFDNLYYAERIIDSMIRNLDDCKRDIVYLEDEVDGEE